MFELHRMLTLQVIKPAKPLLRLGADMTKASLHCVLENPSPVKDSSLVLLND